MSRLRGQEQLLIGQLWVVALLPEDFCSGDLGPGDAYVPWESRTRSGPLCMLKALALLSVSFRQRDSRFAQASWAALSYTGQEAQRNGPWRGRQELWVGSSHVPYSPTPPLLSC